ncbi:hypothetical protein CEQ90_10290 [Lewinellaceae bacterium SD302]|nr:hypothetical protein CEQ90_10290 [Lewinellaceae bacterium SD302]
MQVQYQLLFRINCQHSYFHDGKCRQLKLVPSESSAQLMQHYGLRLVERDGFYEVFFRSDQAANPFLSEDTKDFVLSFRLLVADQRFYNYTDLEISDFSQNGWLSDWAVESDSFNIYGLSEGLVPKILPDSEEIDDEASVIFLEDGVIASDFGLLSILFPLAGGVTEGWLNSENTPSVTLNFTARKTIWRYYIIPQGGDFVLDSTKITGGEEMIDGANFNLLPEKHTLANGTDAAVLESSVPIALKEQYPQYLNLSINRPDQGEDAPVELRLPNPNAERISDRSPSDTPSVSDGYYSDQYIYL